MNTDSSVHPSPAPVEGAVALSHWGVIAADGEEAAKFLHSQLTQDFALLGTGEARLAGLCSPKGRLMFSFVGWKESASRVLLALPAEQLPAALKRLSMYVLRAKAKLSDASASVRLLGLAGPAARAWLGEQAPDKVWGRSAAGDRCVIRLPDALGEPRYLWAEASTDAAAAQAGPQAALPSLPLGVWQWLEVQSGVPSIVPATMEQFVPQMVNLEAVGGVNFQKGCYPGQEVVARSQYRGTLKRRGFLLHSPQPAAPGQEIFHSADPGQPAGLIANAAEVPAGLDTPGWAVFAELKLAAAEGGSLHLGSADGPPLSLRPLPYALPTES
ncbi:CAF17-like 4Fe-4S cluster assembly/insertion protein YgfZ [Eleftheria terrae]|uniref:CAF17-like 4Fe-4S cluster assembly/insertion protein YgfZ n=1 Tax=Eleftheria terrae TaxID=1597781 RepID=UPI00263A45D9|nr:folate-binding protein [Eleftheria terrae]WKB53301.1 folate-binding protein [Eleftheria terrae]